MAITINFPDEVVCTLREPNRAERVVCIEITEQIDSEKRTNEEVRALNDRAEQTLLGMVTGVTVKGKPEEKPRDYAHEQGWFLTGGVGYIARICFRQSGDIVARNGDLGLGIAPTRSGTAEQGKSPAQILDR